MFAVFCYTKADFYHFEQTSALGWKKYPLVGFRSTFPVEEGAFAGMSYSLVPNPVTNKGISGVPQGAETLLYTLKGWREVTLRRVRCHVAA